MPMKRLIQMLDKKKIPYEIIDHTPAYTAQEIAGCSHINGQDLAKVVMVKLDGKMAMCVLPAPYKINLDLLRNVTGCQEVEIALESEFKPLFDDCETGAMPPFGNMFDMEVHVAESLAQNKWICFNAGNHHQLIKMKYKDFEKLEHPKVEQFSVLLAA